MKNLEIKNYEFEQSVEKFRERLRVQGASVGQVYTKPNMIREFLHFIEQNKLTKLTQINQKIVNQYFDYLNNRSAQTKDGGLSGNYINKHREVVLRFIEFTLGLSGMSIGIGQSNIKIKFIKTDSIPKEILTEAEVKLMFDTLDNTQLGIRDRAILSLLYGCGIRRKELRTLEVHEIDLAKGLVHLDKTKTKYSRDVPMNSKVQANIEEYLFSVRNLMLDEYNTESRFLISERGTALSDTALGKLMERISEKTAIGKNIGCHILRHSIATHMLHAGFSLEKVALFLGHRNLDSTQIYTHLKYRYYE